MYGFNFQLLVFIYRNRFQAKVLNIQLAIVSDKVLNFTGGH